MFDRIIDGIIPLLALAAMEIVLGIDNLVFIAILSGKLPEEQRPLARQIGLAVALVTRLLLLFLLTWFMAADTPLRMGEWVGLHSPPEAQTLAKPGAESTPHTAHDAPAKDAGVELSTWHRFVRQFNRTSLKDLILLIGGLFLIGKSVLELHHMAEDHGSRKADAIPASFAMVIAQIALMDMVFSLDSVITAVGMVKPEDLWIMITSIILAVFVMITFANPVSEFVDRHPTLKVLALSFLILIGVMLTGEGTGQHIEKGYIYFAMAFALLVEIINMRIRAAQGHEPAEKMEVVPPGVEVAPTKAAG